MFFIFLNIPERLERQSWTQLTLWEHYIFSLCFTHFVKELLYVRDIHSFIQPVLLEPSVPTVGRSFLCVSVSSNRQGHLDGSIGASRNLRISESRLHRIPEVSLNRNEAFCFIFLLFGSDVILLYYYPILSHKEIKKNYHSGPLNNVLKNYSSSICVSWVCLLDGDCFCMLYRTKMWACFSLVLSSGLGDMCSPFWTSRGQCKCSKTSRDSPSSCGQGEECRSHWDADWVWRQHLCPRQQGEEAVRLHVEQQCPRQVLWVLWKWAWSADILCVSHQTPPSFS